MNWVAKIEKSIINKFHKEDEETYGIYELPLQEMQEFLKINDYDELIELGYNFLEGKQGFDKNIRKAISLFERAESLKSSHAAMILYLIYSNEGTSIKGDGSKGHYYYKLAEKYIKSNINEEESAKKLLRLGDNNLIKANDIRLNGIKRFINKLDKNS